MEASIVTLVPRGSDGMPRAPGDIADAVELWARKSGRTGKMHFFPPAGWFARFERRPNDPALRAFQEGRQEDPGGEDVFFHVRNPYDGRNMSLRDVKADRRFRDLPLIDWWNGLKVRMPAYLQLDVLQMGASGVTSYLEKDDTWSGRGIYGSINEAVKDQLRKDEEGKAGLEASLEEQAGRRAKDLRRKILKIPYVRVLFGKSRPGNRKEK